MNGMSNVGSFIHDSKRNIQEYEKPYYTGVATDFHVIAEFLSRTDSFNEFLSCFASTEYVLKGPDPGINDLSVWVIRFPVSDVEITVRMQGMDTMEVLHLEHEQTTIMHHDSWMPE